MKNHLLNKKLLSGIIYLIIIVLILVAVFRGLDSNIIEGKRI